MTRRILAIVLLVGITALLAAPVVAAQAQTPQAQNEFVPVKDLPPQEQLPATPLVAAAYAFVWVVLIVYVWSLSRRMRKVQAEIGDLRRRAEARK